MYSVEVLETPGCEAAGGKETSSDAMISQKKVGAVTPGAATELTRASWWVVLAPAAALP